jgi:hypothetical protein
MEINLMVHKLFSAGILTGEKELCLRFKSQQEKKLKEKKHEEKPRNQRSVLGKKFKAKTSQGDEQTDHSETKDKYESKTNKGNSFVGNGSTPKISK